MSTDTLNHHDSIATRGRIPTGCGPHRSRIPAAVLTALGLAAAASAAFAATAMTAVETAEVAPAALTLGAA